MNADKLGEKIRILRKRRGMTQSELCGEFITRNMLSRIETGAAMPSLETLLYIAKKLEISPGWLIDDDMELSGFEKSRFVGKIKALYKDKKYAECGAECRRAPADFIDDEVCVIAADSMYMTALQNLRAGFMASAESMFSSALVFCTRGLIRVRALEETVRAFLGYIKAVYVNSRFRDDLSGCKLPDPLPPYEGAQCLRLNIFIKNGRAELTRSLLETGALAGSCSEQVSAAIALAAGDIDGAEEKFRELVKAAELPAEIMYLTCSELEVIARRKQNYKLAYICAERKLELINRAAK